jgi:hypothetical protein
MQHTEDVSSLCRLCQSFMSESSAMKRSLTSNEWLIPLINKHYLKFDDESQFPKSICNPCYQNLTRHKSKDDEHVKKQRKFPEAKKTAYVHKNMLVVKYEIDWIHTGDNCKVCAFTGCNSVIV